MGMGVVWEGETEDTALLLLHAVITNPPTPYSPTAAIHKDGSRIINIVMPLMSKGLYLVVLNGEEKKNKKLGLRMINSYF